MTLLSETTCPDAEFYQDRGETNKHNNFMETGVAKSMDYFSEDLIPKSIREVRGQVLLATGEVPILSTRGDTNSYYIDLNLGNRNVRAHSTSPEHLLRGDQDDSDSGLTAEEAADYLVNGISKNTLED